MSKIKAMIKKCDDLFSQCVRLRDKGGLCFTCGRPFKGIYQAITCGHFMHRRHMATRWSFENAYGQCWECNGKDDWNLFREKLVEFIGEEKTEMIIRQAREEVHLSYLDLKDIYEALLQYRTKIKSV